MQNVRLWHGEIGTPANPCTPLNTLSWHTRLLWCCCTRKLTALPQWSSSLLPPTLWSVSLYLFTSFPRCARGVRTDENTIIFKHMRLYPWCGATNRDNGVCVVVSLCHDGLITAVTRTPAITHNRDALPHFIWPQSVTINLHGRWLINDLAFADGDTIRDIFGCHLNGGTGLLRLFHRILFLVAAWRQRWRNRVFRGLRLGGSSPL